MSKTSPEERKLNKEQKEAVEYGSGPLLIIAGAGTGKTTVVTERIKHVIASEKAKPSEILALTFTEKAAREMQERVDVIMPYGYTQMWISTFHSFCDRILRSEAIHVGLNPAYRLLTDADATILVRKHLFSFDLDYFRPLGNPTKFIAGMLQHFSRLKDEDVSPNEYLLWVKSKARNPKSKTNSKSKVQTANEEKEELEKYKELARAYKFYEELKIKEGVMDFSDLIANTLLLFRKRKNILALYQKQFRYILVDEFQDTNIAQNELVVLLSGKKKNITAVADDDQCLPAGALVKTPRGDVPIRKIKRGDTVITSVGKGYLSTSIVSHVNKTRKNARFITFVTKSGARIETTDNHQLFCHIPGRKFGTRFFYVYLMQRRNLGWRLGITDDLAQRLRLERSADRIIAIRACSSEEEARFYESIYSLRYGIPTYPFKPRNRMVLTRSWLIKLFQEIDSEAGVRRLAHDVGINLTSHHFALGGVVRGDSERVKVTVRMCYRRNRTKWASDRLLINPAVSHKVYLETSSKKTIEKIRAASISITKAKRGWKVNRQFSSLTEASKFAKYLVEITNGIFEVKMDVAKRNASARFALVMPAGNIFPGMHIPVIKGYTIAYEQVMTRQESVRTETVYDLEIERTHNFIADSVAIHNSIYKFRGAAVSNVISFRKHFPKTHVIVLSQNYRSSQTILDRSYRLIQHNNPDRLEVKEEINKKLTAARKITGSPVSFIHTDRVENEAEEVGKTIKTLKLKLKNQYNWKDFAILVRANNHAEPFVRALSRHGIPYQFLGPGQLFRQPEIKDLIAYLQFLNNIEDNVALFRVLNMPFFDYSPRFLAGLSAAAKRQNLTLFEAAEKEEKMKNFVAMAHRHLGLLTKETAGQILYYFLEDTGMLTHIVEYKLPIDERKAANISRFFNKLKTYEVDHEDASVPAVLDWILLAMEMGESPLAADTDWVQNDAVNILTVHSAKGLEFPVVFLVNLVSQRFPTRERREQIPIPDALIKEELPAGDYHIEEERRLFYVGMTRSRDLLYLTAADYYGEGKREKQLSPFVYEALGDVPLAVTASSQISLLDWKKEEEAMPRKMQQYAVTYLSYSQIETFRLCPLHYKLRYILGIPTPPSASLSFGTSVHAALRDFYQSVARGEKVSKEKLLEFLDHNWVREGYDSKAYEEKMRQRGHTYLSSYFETAFDPKARVVALEQPFTVPLSLGKRVVKIGGKTDRVDLRQDGSIEIVDYKTGRIPSKRELDTNLQLSMYALAATQLREPPFGRKPEDIFLTLYFLDAQDKAGVEARVTTQRTMEQLEEEKNLIAQIAEDIERSDFACSGHEICKKCEYQIFCAANG